MTREIAIKTAAKWWTDKLRERAPHSNGDNSPGSLIAMALADIMATPLSEKQLAKFQKALEETIDQDLNIYGDYGIRIVCDYGPDHILFGAAHQANINANNFPYKTNMAIKKNGDAYTVLVSDGYDQPYEKVKPCE